MAPQFYWYLFELLAEHFNEVHIPPPGEKHIL